MPPERASDRDVPPPEAAAVEPRLSLYRRLMEWVKNHRRKAILLVLAAVISLSATATGLRMLMRPAPLKELPSLDAAYAALDAGNYEDARQRVDEYAALVPNDATGGPDFIRGAAAAYLATKNPSVEQDRHCLVAAGYLQEARRRIFPPGREGEAMYLLGKCLYLSGQNAACRPVLQEALKLAPSEQIELHLLLSDADRCEAVPKLAEAEAENRAALAAVDVSPALHRRARVQQIELLLARGKLPEAAAAVAALGKGDHADSLLLRAQIVMGEARGLKRPEQKPAAAAKYQEAIGLLKQSQAADPVDAEITRRAMYLAGMCLAEQGERQAAIAQFQRTERMFPDKPEGWNALVYEADLLSQANRNDEALAAYHRALEAVTEAGGYSSPWMSLAEFRKHVLAYYQTAIDRQDFETAVALCRELSAAFPPDRALELTAQTYRTWGNTVLDRAEQLPMAKAEQVRREGRSHLREAGRTYYALARQLFIDRRFPDCMWDSIQAYLDGHDYQEAIRVLEEYLQNEARRRHPDALLALGEALLAEGRPDDAIKAFSDCVTLHPHDASAFRARLCCARAYREKDDLSRAEGLLRENLNADLLTPASTEWRESLFDLGRLLYTQHRYAEAIARLEEAVARYPNSTRTPDCLYLVAEAYLRQARGIGESLPQALVENTRLLRTRQMNESLHEALATFKKLRDTLNHAQETTELPESQKMLLRNVYFALGDVQFELGQYEEAIKAYQSAINRYQGVPAALEAYSQIIHAQRRLNRAADVHSTAEQAKLLLRRLKPDAPFAETTNRTRQQWQEFFEKMKNEG
jgi:tetratricopeptide (TPR) repeat protein